MSNTKKLVLVGPMAAGKTTFKQVFFENANPLKLLEKDLEPTRGIESSALGYFEQILGVWDLAGQEINSWLGKRSDVFKEASVIVYMLDASKKLKEAIPNFIKFLKVREKIAKHSKLFLLMNKCDLSPNIEIYNKIYHLERFITVKFPEFKHVCKRTNFYKTSVTEAYFIPTLLTVLEIIKSCINFTDLSIPISDYVNFKNKIKILTIYSPGIWFSIGDISDKLRLKITKTKKLLSELHYYGFLNQKKNNLNR